ncbi:hypothetical protein KEJ24_07580 [Candidatus Bathyarchaeota archaeon]|nr:hypothetical protein [Candidatus Bathyarchaeota archaeon]
MKRLDEASTFIVMHDQKPSFEQLRIWLDKICNDIAIKYGLLTPSGKPRKAFVLDTLLKYSCRGCIRKALQHHEADGRVDALYIQNHRLAIGLLIEGLRSIFESSGLSLNVGLEVTGDFGKSDVVVKPTWTGVSVRYVSAGGTLNFVKFLYFVTSSSLIFSRVNLLGLISCIKI